MEKTKLSLLISGLLTLGLSSPVLAEDIINSQTKVVDYLWNSMASNTLSVGNVTDGFLVVTAGGNVQNQLLNIGRNGANGQVDIINGGRFQLADSNYSYPLAIGGDGSDGSKSLGRTGIMNIIGVGSEFSSVGTNEHSVGSNGAVGILTISDGGKMLLTANESGWNGLWIGSRGSVGTQGTVIVDGTGSELYSKARIIVGTFNEGSAIIRNGGTMATDNTLSVGRTATTKASDSLLLVTGIGSSVTSGLTAAIGYSGTGTAVISDKATLTAPNIEIASQYNSKGELAIGSRTGQAATAAGVVNTAAIKFGLGTGSLVFNHTSDDYLLAANISGKGVINALSGTTTLIGNNSAYQGPINIAEPATILIAHQNNLGANNIVNNGALSIVTDNDWGFTHTMSGDGQLKVNTDGHQFTFNTTTTTDNFNGSLVLANTKFGLSGVNSAVLSHIDLKLASGSQTVVGSGQQTIKGLSFAGGTLSFGQVTPGQIMTDNTINTTGVLDISGAGTVQVDISGIVSNDRPTVNTEKSLLDQDNGQTLIQLANSSGSTIGNGGSLVLVDQNGTVISNSMTSSIEQNSQIVANSTYDYRLSSGQDNDGLYISYGLTAIELLGQNINALVLDAESETGISAELSAKITGSGDLAIDTGIGQSITLSNLNNDYQGITDIRSGSLQMLNSHVLGNTSLLQLANNTGLEMDGYSQTVGQLEAVAGSKINLNGGALTITNGGNVNGQLTGSGTLTMTGGVLDITGANLSLSASINIGDSAKAIINDVDGLGRGDIVVKGEFAVNHVDGTLVNNISDSGKITLTESHITLTGNSTLFTGEFNLDADSQLVGIEGNLGAATVNNSGELVINNSSAWLVNNTIQGRGSLTKQGSGIATLTSNATYSGVTDIQQGGLILGSASDAMTLASQQITIHEEAFLAGFGGVDGSIENSGRLYVGAPDSAVNDVQTFTVGQHLTNRGAIYIGQNTQQDSHLRTANNITAPGNHLHIIGNYRSHDGYLYFNTALNGDDSITDKMIIDGNTEGTTYVSVNNVGGSGVQTINGIELVQVNGQSDGEFIQAGRIVAGAYDYSLARGEGALASNWYLSSYRNSPEASLRPDAGAYVANLAEANTLFVSRLHDRAGEAQSNNKLTGEKNASSLWLRQSGGLAKWSSGNGQLATKSYRYVLQLGGDIAQWSSNELDRWHVGTMLGYANSHSNTRSNLTGYSARANVDGYSGGLYATWYQHDQEQTGLYVDSWLQYSWFNNQVNGEQLTQERYKSKGFTSAIESGYTYKLGQFSHDGGTIDWYIRPQAQAVWMGIKADDHVEANGTQVSASNEANLMTRLGVRAYLKAQPANSKSAYQQLEPFVELNWIHNSKDFTATMNNESMSREGARHLGEVKVGISGQVTRPLSIWSHVATQFGDKNYRDTTATMGVKYQF